MKSKPAHIPTKAEPQQNTSVYIPQDVVRQASGHPVLANLCITKMGSIVHDRTHFISRDTINEYIILYCTHGWGWVESGGVRRTVGPGDVVLLDIDQPHAYGAREQDPWTLQWAHVLGNWMPALRTDLALTGDNPILSPGRDPALAVFFRDALEVLSTGYDRANLLTATTHLQGFLCRLYHRDARAIGAPGGPDLDDVLHFMLSRVEQNACLQDFADQAHLSRFHFSRRFREKTGYAPMEYYLRLKIQRACTLFDTTTENVQGVAARLQFSSPYHFSDTFKRITGFSPTQYRKLRGY